jgi:hypothetical protein
MSEERKPTPRNPNQNRAALWRICQQIKVRQPIGRKDSIQTMIPTSRRLNLFLYEVKRLRTLKSFQILKTEINKPKTYSS